MLFATAAGVLLGGCGGHSRSNEASAGQPGGGFPAGAAGAASSEGGAAGTADGGERAGAPPAPVDPAVSRAWTWQPCGKLEPEGADRAALFDGLGRIVVLGPSQVRVHDAAGAVDESVSGAAADFLVVDPDGTVLSGQTTPAGISLTPVGESTPRVVLPSAPVDCGSQFALSADGAYLLASGSYSACAWRVADATFVGSVSGQQVTIRSSTFVSIEDAPSSIDLVQRDFMAHELSRRSLARTSIVVSPAGDRVVVGNALVDVDTGETVAWDVEPAPSGRPPIFSARGEVVLVGDGTYDAKTGVRRFAVPPVGRMATTSGAWRVLAPDGKRALSSADGRATLFDVEALGVSAVLGRPPLADATPPKGTSDLAISRDGSLLVHSVETFSTFGIRVAPSFGDSQVIWGARVEVNLGVDLTSDGHFVAVGGDGQAIYDGRDGHAIWPAEPPPATVVLNDICLLDRVRFSPRATWLASSSYSGELQLFRFDGKLSADPWHSASTIPGHCDAPAFSRDGRLLATSAAALYETSTTSDWKQRWSSPIAGVPGTASMGFASSDAKFSPDETQLLVSRCWTKERCITTLLDVATGTVARSIPELEGPHPSFSPEGSWLVAASKLLHLPSGEVRDLSPDADPGRPAIFTPEGDIIAGSPNGTLTRYCRK